MKSKSKRLMTLLVAGIVTLSLTLSGCGSKTVSNDTEALKVLDYYIGDEPQTLDNQQMIGTIELTLSNFFSEGLTRAEKTDGKYVAGVAKSWEFDKASNTYTFVLNKDAKWINGDPITAADFFFGWRLALDQNTPYSYMLGYIKGVSDYSNVTIKSFLSQKDPSFKALLDKVKAEPDESKQKDLNGQISKRIEAMTATENTEYKKIKDDLWDKVGAKEKDGKLTIQLALPVPYFIGLTAFQVYYPVNEKFYNEHKKAGDYALEASGLLSNGPWTLKTWKHKESFEFVRNDNYWNKSNIKIDQVNLKVVTDVATRTNLLKTGKLDGSAIQSTDLKDFEDSSTLEQYNLQPMVNMPDYSVFYIDYNHFNNKYTQNINIRKAMALAMDRKAFVEKINLGDAPALSIVPNHFPGLTKSFREENGATLFEDNQKDKAREYLAKGLKELNLKALPPLDMLIDIGDISMKIAQKYQEDWKQVGITINLFPMPWSEKMNRLQSGSFALCADGWGPDYADPMTFLELFETDNGNNYGKYSNKKYDDLVEKARYEIDPAKRMSYFYAAEKLLIDDMAVAPNYFRVAHWTFKKYLTGVVSKGIGANTDFYYADIDMDAKNADKK